MGNLEYNPIFKYLCVQNCVFHTLNILGCTNSQHLMRCPMDYHARKIYNSESKNTCNILFQMPSTSECVLSFIDFKVFSSEESEKVWFENKKMLENGMPIIALVDVYYLCYRKEYQTLHGSHAVIVVDYYENNGCVKIIDWYEPYFFIGLIKLKDFLMARDSKNPKCSNPYSGRPIFNEWLYVFPNKYKVTKEACLLENLSLSLEVNNVGNEIYGTNSIKQIAKLIENNPNEKFFGELHENFFPIGRLCNLFFSNIQEVIYNDVDMKKYQSNLLDYENKFQELLFLILKLSVKTKKESYEKLLKKIETFSCLTQEIYDILQSINQVLLSHI